MFSPIVDLVKDSPSNRQIYLILVLWLSYPVCGVQLTTLWLVRRPIKR
jgi:hypothetical protein